MSMVLDPLGYSGRMREEEEGEEEEVDVESVSMASLLPQKGEKKLLASQLQCIKIYLLEPLGRHPKSTAFRKPVDPLALGIPHYPKIISKPMDLGTVKDKIRTRKYATYNDCLRDVELIWKNAKTFNPVDHFIHKIAIELEDFSKEKVSKIDFTNCRYTDLPSNKRRKANVNINNNHPSVPHKGKLFEPAANRLQKAPIDACREILEELVDSEVHAAYAGPFKRLPGLDLIKLRNRLRRGVYLTPHQVADDFRSIIARTYRRSPNELCPRAQLASQLQHKFEVMFARRVSVALPPKQDLSDANLYTQTLLAAQDNILSIQRNLEHLFTSFYMNKGNRRKQQARKKRPLPEAPSPPKKRPKWSREEIIDLQTRIGQLDEHHQQPILSLMHKNGEKITEDEEGYVVLDIEEASSKSLCDIKNYIDTLPSNIKEEEPKPVVVPLAAAPAQPPVPAAPASESDSSSESDESSSDSSSDDSSDED